MRRHWLVTAATVVLLAGCTSSGSGAPAWPVGREFVATHITENGHDRPLIPGTRLLVEFETDKIVAHAGCNEMDLSVTPSSDRINVTEQSTTLIACPDGLNDQDQWLAAFFTAGPTWHLSGDQLTLATATTTIDLLDERVAEPHPIVGSRWVVADQFDRHVVSSLPQGIGTITFGADGTVTAVTGCATFTGSFTIDQNVVPTTISFAQLAKTDSVSCPPNLEPLDAAVQRTLIGDVTATVKDRILTLTTVDGTGLTLTAG
jgi:heat shock protein HslJ